MSNKLLVRKVAVLGAGVMGAQIAAHLANANVDSRSCSTCPPRKATRTAIVEQGHRQPGKLEPSPLASEAAAAADHRRPTTTSTSTLLRDCDLVIEAIAERMDWKKDLYEKIAPHRRPTTRSSPATPRACRSTSWRRCCPKQLRHRFCGVHFFNPPRYMHLVELIPTPRHRRRGAGRPRDLPRHHARQGRGPRQGHAQLHRQPHRRVLDAGHACTTPPHSAWASTRSMR